MVGEVDNPQCTRLLAFRETTIDSFSRVPLADEFLVVESLTPQQHLLNAYLKKQNLDGDISRKQNKRLCCCLPLSPSKFARWFLSVHPHQL